MRIISKYKDYYDYYAGIFGIDNNKIYKRKIVDAESSSHKDIDTLVFAICGKIYTIFRYENTLYHTPDELEQLDKINIELPANRLFRTQFIPHDFRKTKHTAYQDFYNSINGINTDVNVNTREPVLLKNERVGFKRDAKWTVPLLNLYEFHKVIDAKDIYIQIETFLGWLVDNPPLPDSQTNIGKIESHGFDIKSSFRPNIKQ